MSQCPACNTNSSNLLSWNFSGLNNSIFNYSADYKYCRNCGLVWINNINDNILEQFYKNECSYFENSHFDIDNEINKLKYSIYQKFIQNETSSSLSLVDVGCGRGGLLNWLHKNSWKGELTGVDIDTRSLPNEINGVHFYNGTAVKLPFENNSKDIITSFHVLEHIKSTNDILKEAHRVLKLGGALVIEVPNACRYSEAKINDGYWVSIREHIYHFSPQSICHFLYNNGFEVETISEGLLPTPEFKYPSLLIKARKTNNNNLMNISFDQNSHLFIKKSFELMSKRSIQIMKEIPTDHGLVFWGVSNQLLAMIKLFKNRDHDIQIVDMNKHKQGAKIQNHLIISPEEINPEFNFLIASSFLHEKSIRLSALELGWNVKKILALI